MGIKVVNPLPVTGLILAGGKSLRMGKNKALLPFKGKYLIQWMAHSLQKTCAQVMLSTNTPRLYQFLALPMVSDRFADHGPLAGVHAALPMAQHPWIFVLACDMPNWSEDLLHFAWQYTASEQFDVICPSSEAGVEPLHALYHRRCLPAMEQSLEAGEKRIVAFFPKVRVRKLSWQEIQHVAANGQCFINWNSPEDIVL